MGWSYDAAGHRLSNGTTTSSYDALNRLITQGSVTNAYNGDGVLVQRGTTRYTQDLAAPLSQILSDGTTTYLYGSERLRALNGPWYVSDGLGSVRQTLNDAGTPLASAWYDPWGTPQGSAIAPFGFTGELQDAGLVELRARWYHQGNGTFTAKDPFAGWAAQPYSLSYYSYAANHPILLTDPTGNTPVCPVLYCTVQTFVDWRLRNWDFNWDLVRSIKGLIIKAAQNHERPGDDFPWQTMAALMGAHVAREKRTQMLEYDTLGELKATVEGSNNPSTGIANIRPDVVVKTYNGELEFDNTESQPGKYQFTTLNLFQECLGDGVLDKSDYKAIRGLLQSPEVSLDILGANIERGIDRIRLYEIQPSIFNAGNWIWNGNQDPVVIQQGINEGLPIDDVTKGYIHGLVMIQQLPKAAQELGISLPIYRKYHTDTDLTKDESQFIPDELK